MTIILARLDLEKIYYAVIELMLMGKNYAFIYF